ncbi:O-antigen ligase family protein [Mesobacillus persicus]
MNLDYIWLLVLTFMVILGFWNHFSLQHLPVSRLYDAAAYVRHRPTAVFTNENDYASYLALSFFFALGVLHRSKYIIIKFFSGFLLISCLYQILVSSSRANLLALLIGGAIWFLFFTSKREKRFLLFFGGFSFIIASLLFPDRILSAYSEVISQFSSFFVPADYADASNDIRINLLKNTLLFIANSVGMGIGAGNVESYIEKYALFPTAGTLNVHNWWAEVFLHYGFFVFVGYLLVYLWLMVKLYRIFKESITWEDKLIAQSLCTSLVAFSVASISPSSLMTLNYAWILFALAIAFINYWMKKNLLDKK